MTWRPTETERIKYDTKLTLNSVFNMEIRFEKVILIKKLVAVWSGIYKMKIAIFKDYKNPIVKCRLVKIWRKCPNCISSYGKGKLQISLGVRITQYIYWPNTSMRKSVVTIFPCFCKQKDIKLILKNYWRYVVCRKFLAIQGYNCIKWFVVGCLNRLLLSLCHPISTKKQCCIWNEILFMQLAVAYLNILK